MALSTGTNFEVRSTATAGNTGGSGFNPGNSNFPTDLAADTNTGNTAAPVVSSATYTFVAGDVGAWVYIAAGTNWLVGWYQIASVAAGKATLTATIGAGAAFNSTLQIQAPSTVAGVATVGTPTGGTFGIDYSQQDTAQATATDYASVGASTTLTSATGGFTRMMVGNFFHQTTTGTGAFGVTGWYEIVSYTNATTVVLDRTPNSGTASVACTGFVGGAGRFNALEDPFLEMIPAGSRVWFKTGTHIISGAVSVASTNSTSTSPSFLIGYTTVRGDTCNGANRTQLTCGANLFTSGQNQSLFNLIVTGTSTTTCTLGVGAMAQNCKIINTSSTASRTALSLGADCIAFSGEMVSQMGTGVLMSSRTKCLCSYIHDSKTGLTSAQPEVIIIGNILEACETVAIANTATIGSNLIQNNTIYGTEAKIGIGVFLNAATSPFNILVNNILYGLTTAVSCSTIEQRTNMDFYNDYFNNTADTSLYVKNSSDLALNPGFVGASQITGSTATSSGSTLTQSGGAFGGVNDNVDYLHVISGTGVTAGIYLITGHTTTTLTTNNALGTSGAGDIVYFITNGHNFQIGSNLAGVGAPNFIGSGLAAQSYMDVGAYQRLAGSAGGSFTFS